MEEAQHSDAPEAWPFYCEENVWHACRQPVEEGREAYALFVSGLRGRVAMWSQRAAAPGEPIAWDYHVVLLERDPDWRVWDPDCRAGPRLDALHWLEQSFRLLAPRVSWLAPRFRLVPAADFREEFRSDRRHMRQGDRWSAPPPPWPPIGRGSNLSCFVDMATTERGPVYTLETLRRLLES